MDGTSRTVLHDTSLSSTYGLTMDYGTQMLYWADYSLDRLERSSADGSNRVLLTTSNIISPFGITVSEGVLYWTDWTYDRIYSAPVSSPSSATILASYVGTNPYGIEVISEGRQELG